jgi:hypothetical protein
LSLMAKAHVAKVWPGPPPVDPIKIERMDHLRMRFMLFFYGRAYQNSVLGALSGIRFLNDSKREGGCKLRTRPSPPGGWAGSPKDQEVSYLSPRSPGGSAYDHGEIAPIRAQEAFAGRSGVFWPQTRPCASCECVNRRLKLSIKQDRYDQGINH